MTEIAPDAHSGPTEGLDHPQRCEAYTAYQKALRAWSDAQNRIGRLEAALRVLADQTCWEEEEITDESGADWGTGRFIWIGEYPAHFYSSNEAPEPHPWEVAQRALADEP